MKLFRYIVPVLFLFCSVAGRAQEKPIKIFVDSSLYRTTNYGWTGEDSVITVWTHFVYAIHFYDEYMVPYSVYKTPSKYRCQIYDKKKVVYDTLIPCNFITSNMQCFSISRELFNRYSKDGVMKVKISTGKYSTICSLYGDRKYNNIFLYANMSRGKKLLPHDYDGRRWVDDGCTTVIIDNDKNLYQYYFTINNELPSDIARYARVYKDRNHRLMVQIRGYDRAEPIVVNLRSKMGRIDEWMRLYIYVTPSGDDNVVVKQNDGDTVVVRVAPHPCSADYRSPVAPYLQPEMPSIRQQGESEWLKSLKEW